MVYAMGSRVIRMHVVCSNPLASGINAFVTKAGREMDRPAQVPQRIYSTRSAQVSLLRVINVKFPLLPQQKYYITQYEELGFSSSTRRLLR